MLGLLGLVYTLAYFNHPLLPGNKPASPLGWWEWVDQSWYLKATQGLAKFQLNQDVCHYPLGYPLLGALFWRLMPSNPFFIPDLVLVLATAWVWWGLALRLLSRLQALVVGVLFIGFHAALLGKTVVIPWNTLPTQFTLLCGIGLVVSENKPRTATWLSILTALTYFTRPSDALAFAPLLIFSVLRLPGIRTKVLTGLVGLAIVAIPVIAVGIINLSVFGHWRSSYEDQTIRFIGFFGYPMFYKLYWIFLDGKPVFNETKTALLFHYPWLLLAIPGVLYWIKKEGFAAVVAILTLALNWTLYLNYNDFLPSDLFRFNLIHYLAWGFPLLALLSAAAVLRGWRERSVRMGFGIAAAGLIAALGVHLEEQALPNLDRSPVAGTIVLPQQRPVLMSFDSLPLKAVTAICSNGEQLHECHDYLVPFASENLRMLLSKNVTAHELQLSSDTRTKVDLPRYSVLVWTWHLSPRRLLP